MSLSQQIVSSLEHLIIDGASTDNTVAIAQAHLRPGGRIITEPDNGLYDAMNKGLRLAQGDIVGFLNADDVYADDTVLATIARAFEDPSVDAVFGDLVYVTHDLKRVVRYWDASRFTPAAFAYGIMPPHPTVYIRRSVIERYGGFDLSLKMANDFEFCVRYFARHRIRAKYIPKVLVKMRVGGESNKSWRNVLVQNRCILQALRMHGITPNPLAPFLKTLNKAEQFVAAHRAARASLDS